MNANPNLLQKKYARLIQIFAQRLGILYDEALDFFYKSETYRLVKEGISDLHCMSDEYLVTELLNEYNPK